ncbi:LysM peptidoglycan-binding domain-containing protein [Alicyclobacillus mengziensis]|uniref:LysM peptidoglycan-binding domain-containing protein n=1 Tax=Alicyclobacillus mengziensis TaxID=2931921 RepID=A0A9X7VXE8_9BACL|nr:LysM peptidoglycan-binding domain-containing protein [Alicyclobacillus mengziensis]QSO45518.1 LysM peptidoglycan-binding domain-containing protein [Alicyclobacillus mengziensis]
MQTAYSGSSNGYTSSYASGGSVRQNTTSRFEPSRFEPSRFESLNAHAVRNLAVTNTGTPSPSGRAKSLRRSLVIIVVAIMWVCALFSAFHHSAGIASAETTGVPYVVHSGDTLWSIAQKESPVGADPRTVVLQIMRFNHMQSAQIYPGETLLLPNGR